MLLRNDRLIDKKENENRIYIYIYISYIYRIYINKMVLLTFSFERLKYFEWFAWKIYYEASQET